MILMEIEISCLSSRLFLQRHSHPVSDCESTEETDYHFYKMLGLFPISSSLCWIGLCWSGHRSLRPVRSKL